MLCDMRFRLDHNTPFNLGSLSHAATFSLKVPKVALIGYYSTCTLYPICVIELSMN